MTSDTIELGAAPYEESCAQVGEPDYAARAMAECLALRNQIMRENAISRVTLEIKRFAHDFGAYWYVVARYDTNDPAAADEALRLEGNFPATWDDEARVELKAKGVQV